MDTLVLEPLPTKETAKIVRERFTVEALSDGLAALVAEKADGNALFAEELAGFLLEQDVGRITPDGLGFDAAAIAQSLPASIQSLLTVRVDRLNPADRALLQAASVIGRGFDAGLLAAVTGVSTGMEERLEALQSLDLVYAAPTSGEYVFKHALVKDALYGSLLSGRRKEMHKQAAEAIEIRSDNRLIEAAEVLAHHYSRTDATTKTFIYMVMAGEKCLRVYSLDEAEQYLRHALMLLDQIVDHQIDQEAIDARILFLEILWLQFKYRDIKKFAEACLGDIRRSDNKASIVRGLYYYGYSLIGLNEYRQADAVQEDAVALASSTDNDAAKAYAFGLALFCVCILMNRPPDVVAMWKEEAITCSERARDDFIWNFNHFVVAWHFTMSGLVVDARAVATKLIESGRVRNDPRASGTGLWVLGWIDILSEEYNGALASAEACVNIAVTALDRELARAVRGTALVFLGQLQEGRDVLRDCESAAQKSGWYYYLTGIDPAIGISRVLAGEITSGVNYLVDVLRRREAEGSAVAYAWTQMYLLEVYLEILISKKIPPLRILLNNIVTIVDIKINGNRKIKAMLSMLDKNPIIGNDSFLKGRLELDRGTFYKFMKKSHQARQCLYEAQRIAEKLGLTTMLERIASVQRDIP